MIPEQIPEDDLPTEIDVWFQEPSAKRALWSFFWLVFYRPSPRPFHAWRSMLLRLFGAQMGPRCHFYPDARVSHPWNLVCADAVTLGDKAEILNPEPIKLESHAIISQGACVLRARSLGAYAWVCAHATVGPGVRIGDGAVLGLASVTSADLEAWGVYAGNPARKVKERKRHALPIADILIP